MLLILYLIFILLNGRVTLEILLLGIPIALALYLFSCKYLGYSLDFDKALFKIFPLVIWYALMVVWEVIKANIEVIKIVLSPKIDVDPVIFYFKTDLKSEKARVALANTITLTPGTITVTMKDDVICIHALKKEMAEGLPIWHMIKTLHKIEDIALGTVNKKAAKGGIKS